MHHETRAAAGDNPSESTVILNTVLPYKIETEFKRPQKAKPSKPASIIEDMIKNGFRVVRRNELDLSQVHDVRLIQQVARHAQQEDPAPGRRWRSHSKLELRNGHISLLPATPYMQRYEDNPDDGGKERPFMPIADEALSTDTLAFLLEFNRMIARGVRPQIFESEPVSVGLHVVSYRPEGTAPSYASPIWFHKDTEEYVAVVLLGLSRNLGGGENAISSGGRQIEAIFTLRDPLDMLLLTRRDFHAVMPMYSLDGGPAHRDVLLITFG